MISKKILLPALAVVVIGGATVWGTTIVHAQTTNPFSDLVDRIAQKFGLDKTQVQSVFDQYRSDKRQQMITTMQQREKTRLDDLVKNGKITSAQEQAILDEQTALKNKYNPSTGNQLTPEQRKQQFESMQNDIKTWATSQGIDPSYVLPGFGKGGRKGMGRHGGWNILR